ncbi:MAG TPA: pyridoxamine 5'-phosphate oxidase family protein [Candidatus Saccharimonadales bacterium]|nr:pyridoxamine 5'-phosphate oxidase family protein [Candidatus Saccharimonadales bacterium]
MNEIVQARIERAKELLQTVRHVALATVNLDDSPHNSPVFMAFGKGLRGYWASHPDSQHSQNIARSGQVFLVLFDSMGKGGGLYVRARAQQVAEDELEPALAAFNRAKARVQPNLKDLAIKNFTQGSPQRLYMAVPEQIWVNVSEHDAAGHIIRDVRHEISADKLFGSEDWAQ